MTCSCEWIWPATRSVRRARPSSLRPAHCRRCFASRDGGRQREISDGHWLWFCSSWRVSRRCRRRRRSVSRVGPARHRADGREHRQLPHLRGIARRRPRELQIAKSRIAGTDDESGGQRARRVFQARDDFRRKWIRHSRRLTPHPRREANRDRRSPRVRSEETPRRSRPFPQGRLRSANRWRARRGLSAEPDQCRMPSTGVRHG
jgi:hypothetical protein